MYYVIIFKSATGVKTMTVKQLIYAEIDKIPEDKPE